MNVNKIDMFNNWVLVDGTGHGEGHGVVVKGFGTESLVGSYVHFCTADWGGRIFPFREGDKQYIAVRVADIFGKEIT
jgi:hypothetical protein